jgi:hypothetical protein
MNERELFQKAISKEMPDYERIRHRCLNSTIQKERFVRRNKLAVISSLLLLLILGTGTVYAIDNWFGVGKVTDENRSQLTSTGRTNVSDNDEDKTVKDNWENMIIESLMPIIIKESDGIYEEKDIYITPEYGIKFFVEENKGFELRKGETLNCSVEIDFKNMELGVKSVGLEFGFVKDGQYTSVEDIKGSSFDFYMTAPEEGEYYPCIINRSSTNVLVKDCLIK